MYVCTPDAGAGGSARGVPPKKKNLFMRKKKYICCREFHIDILLLLFNTTQDAKCLYEFFLLRFQLTKVSAVFKYIKNVTEK